MADVPTFHEQGLTEKAFQVRACFRRVIDEQGPVWLDVVRGLNLEPQ
jgi:hypothetical protein